MPRDLSTPDGFGPGSPGSGHAGVRRRLGRFGAPRGGVNPVLEPLIRTVRTTHPKADIRLIERAYEVAAKLPREPVAQERRSLHHAPARRGHDPGRARHEPRHAVRGAAARHDRGHPVHPRRAAPRLRRRDRRPGRRRDQAGQGQVRRGRPGRDRAQDGRRDVARHQGAGDQARRPAAQHADAALPAPAQAGAEVARDAGDLRPARAPARDEHGQVGARGPGVRDVVPQALRRDRPAGLRARAAPGGVHAGGDRGGLRRPAGGEDQGAR